LRRAKLLAVSTPLVKLTSMMPAASRSVCSIVAKSKSTNGRSGMPAGTVPITATPWASRSSATTATTPRATTISGFGNRGRTRRRTTRAARRASPRIAVGPWLSPTASTNSMSFGTKSPAVLS